MTTYLVDTDLLIDVLRGSEWARGTLRGLAGEGIAISLITYGELFEGAHYGRDRDANVDVLRTLVAPLEILGLSKSIMERFAVYRGALPRHLRRQIGDMDIIIAATAVENDLTLVTGNIKDFEHFEGLRVTNSRTR